MIASPCVFYGVFYESMGKVALRNKVPLVPISIKSTSHIHCIDIYVYVCIDVIISY